MRSPSHDPFKQYFHFDKNTSSYDYRAAPDADVFNWDDARLSAIESNSKTRHSGIKRETRRDYDEDVATKELLVKARRVEARLLGSGDKKTASLLRETSLEGVRRVVSARRRYRKRIDLISLPALAFAFVVPMLAPAIISGWVSSDRGWWLLLLGPIELMLGIYLLSRLFTRMAFWDFKFHWILLIYPSIIVLIASVVSAMVVGIRYRNGSPSFPIEFGAGIAVSCLLFIFCLVIALSINDAFQYAGQGAQPETVLFVDLVTLVAIAAEWERLPRQPWPARDSKQQELIEKLEEVARRAERAFPRIASRSNPRLRQWAVDRGHRVAAVIRKHEESVLEVSAAQRVLITASLVNGLVYLLRRDWDSLLVVRPDPGVKPLVRRYAPRVALATLLIVLAFLLPVLLPNLIGDPLSFQATVFVTAAFTLIAPDVQKAADAVRSFAK